MMYMCVCVGGLMQYGGIVGAGSDTKYNASGQWSRCIAYIFGEIRSSLSLDFSHVVSDYAQSCGIIHRPLAIDIWR